MTKRNYKLYTDECGKNYLVYRDGRVYSLKRKKFLSTGADSKGYPIVSFSRPARAMKLHRLLLIVFKREPKVGEEGRHLDGNPSNFELSNLRWGSRSQNQRDRHNHITDPRGDGNSKSLLTEKVVIKMRRTRNKLGPVRTDYCCRMATKYGVSQATIHNAINGSSWKYLNSTVPPFSRWGS